MKFKLPFFALLLSLICYFNSEAADLKNMHASFTTASKVSVIDKKLEQAKSFKELHNVLVMMGDIVLKEYGDTCKPPTPADIRRFCGDLVTKAKVIGEETNFYEYQYEKNLWRMACVNIGVDSEETAIKKIQAWWLKYKLWCKQESTTFSVLNGNILKFAISQRHPQFVETLAETYGLDINFIDPADGKNVLDYLNEEIANRRVDGSSATTIAIYEGYKRILVRVGAKSSK